MSINIKCDICKTEVAMKDRVIADFKDGRIKDICPTCKDGLKSCIELAKVGPFWGEVKKLHDLVFSQRMEHLRKK